MIVFSILYEIMGEDEEATGSWKRSNMSSFASGRSLQLKSNSNITEL